MLIHENYRSISILYETIIGIFLLFLILCFFNHRNVLINSVDSCMDAIELVLEYVCDVNDILSETFQYSFDVYNFFWRLSIGIFDFLMSIIWFLLGVLVIRNFCVLWWFRWNSHSSGSYKGWPDLLPTLLRVSRKDLTHPALYFI